MRSEAGNASAPAVDRPGVVSWLFAGAAALEVTLFLLAGYPGRWIAVGHVLALSVIAFVAFAFDKWRATHQGRRVNELTLLGLALLGGAGGAFLSMRAFRHKTQKLTFRTLVPVAFISHLVVVGWLFIIA